MSNHRFSRRDWLKRAGAYGLLLASGSSRPDRARADDKAGVLDIGSRRELFVDGLLVEQLVGLRLKLHEPRPAGVALKYDGPADERFCFYTTILKDGDTYRMYYRGHPGSDWTKSVTCYAESCDGKTWTKPKLGLVEVKGMCDNNAILPTGEAFGPFLDGRPAQANVGRSHGQPVISPLSASGFFAAPPRAGGD